MYQLHSGNFSENISSTQKSWKVCINEDKAMKQTANIPVSIKMRDWQIFTAWLLSQPQSADLKLILYAKP